MFELWIPITLFAAFNQNIRSALQKHLTSKLSTAGATQVRFFYALPFALIYVAALHFVFGTRLPTPNSIFFIYALCGGLAQIIATELLVSLFAWRNFFVGTVYSKTETIHVAALGFIILSDTLTAGAITGIVIGIMGVMIISSAKSKTDLLSVLRSLTTKAALIGMGSGLFFGITAICIRGASHSLDGGFMIRAAFTLLTILTIQTVLVLLYLVRREPGQMTSVIKHWRISWLVGLTGMLASVGWFTAMTLENAAHVRALGQVELVFAFLASALLFKEKTTKMEFVGVAVIVTGILVLLFYK